MVPMGLVGAMGHIGPMGLMGPLGLVDPRGPMGPMGPMGLMGLRGPERPAMLMLAQVDKLFVDRPVRIEGVLRHVRKEPVLAVGHGCEEPVRASGLGASRALTRVQCL